MPADNAGGTSSQNHRDDPPEVTVRLVDPAVGAGARQPADGAAGTLSGATSAMRSTFRGVDDEEPDFEPEPLEQAATPMTSATTATLPTLRTDSPEPRPVDGATT